jgi:ATP adenylyltransferase
MEPSELSALWAPWRVAYFTGRRTPDFFLKAARAKNDAAHLVVARRAHTFLIMNRYPYTIGHMMAVPKRKVAELTKLTPEEVIELWDLAGHAQALLRKVVKAQGFNVGLNLGKCAGAGVADHLHLHIVPRWVGDHNFMPTIGGKRLLSESVESLYARLTMAPVQTPRQKAKKRSLPTSKRLT